MSRLLVLVLASAVLAACEAPSPRMGETTVANEQQVRFGKITKIEVVTIDDDDLGLGAIIGGVAGGVIGHQIGSGTGTAVATVAGTLGGALLGNKVEKQRRAQKSQGQHIMVRLQNNVTVGITQEPNPSLRVGDDVRIVGSGQDARVVRQ
jgi:outer membrane lipoprotein SlyB